MSQLFNLIPVDHFFKSYDEGSELGLPKIINHYSNISQQSVIDIGTTSLEIQTNSLDSSLKDLEIMAKKCLFSLLHPSDFQFFLSSHADTELDPDIFPRVYALLTKQLTVLSKFIQQTNFESNQFEFFTWSIFPSIFKFFIPDQSKKDGYLCLNELMKKTDKTTIKDSKFYTLLMPYFLCEFQFVHFFWSQIEYNLLNHSTSNFYQFMLNTISICSYYLSYHHKLMLREFCKWDQEACITFLCDFIRNSYDHYFSSDIFVVSNHNSNLIKSSMILLKKHANPLLIDAFLSSQTSYAPLNTNFTKYRLPFIFFKSDLIIFLSEYNIFDFDLMIDKTDMIPEHKAMEIKIGDFPGVSFEDLRFPAIQVPDDIQYPPYFIEACERMFPGDDYNSFKLFLKLKQENYEFDVEFEKFMYLKEIRRIENQMQLMNISISLQKSINECKSLKVSLDSYHNSVMIKLSNQLIQTQQIVKIEFLKPIIDAYNNIKSQPSSLLSLDSFLLFSTIVPFFNIRNDKTFNELCMQFINHVDANKARFENTLKRNCKVKEKLDLYIKFLKISLDSPAMTAQFLGLFRFLSFISTLNNKYKSDSLLAQDVKLETWFCYSICSIKDNLSNILFMFLILYFSKCEKANNKRFDIFQDVHEEIIAQIEMFIKLMTFFVKISPHNNQSNYLFLKCLKYPFKWNGDHKITYVCANGKDPNHREC